MSVTVEQLKNTLPEAWSGLLGLPLVPDNGALPEPTPAALVDLTQVGTLCLRFSPTLARRSAAAMFDSDPAELAEDELCDALGELANVAGGAVKAAAAGDVALSLPRVTLGLAPRRAAETRLATVFSCEDELLEVVLLHPQPALEEVPA